VWTACRVGKKRAGGYLIAFLHDLYIENFDVFLWFLLVDPGVLDLVDNIQTLNRPSKNGMFVIKPRLYDN
jgi:hypothetical protein